MFTGTVHSCKRFLVEQTGEAMTPGHLFHCLHDQLVVIHGNVGCLIDRRKFMLGRRYFIVLGLCRNSQFPQLHI